MNHLVFAVFAEIPSKTHSTINDLKNKLLSLAAAEEPAQIIRSDGDPAARTAIYNEPATEQCLRVAKESESVAELEIANATAAYSQHLPPTAVTYSQFKPLLRRSVPGNDFSEACSYGYQTSSLPKDLPGAAATAITEPLLQLQCQLRNNNISSSRGSSFEELDNAFESNQRVERNRNEVVGGEIYSRPTKCDIVGNEQCPATTGLLKSQSSHLISGLSGGVRDTSVLFDILYKERKVQELSQARDSFFDQHQAPDQLNMSLSSKRSNGLRTSVSAVSSQNGSESKTKNTRRTKVAVSDNASSVCGASSSAAITASSTDDEPTMRLRTRIAETRRSGQSNGSSEDSKQVMTNNKSRIVPVSSGDQNNKSKGDTISHISGSARNGNIRTTKTSRLRAAALGEMIGCNFVVIISNYWFPVAEKKAKSASPSRDVQSSLRHQQPTESSLSRGAPSTEMILRNRVVKRAASQDDKRLAGAATKTNFTGFVKPEGLASRRMVPNIAVSMRQTLCDTNNVVITPPGQLVENSFTFNSPRARTSTMKRDSLSPSLADPPQLSPIQRSSARPEAKVKDKSSKRKSNLNIAFNEESTGE